MDLDLTFQALTSSSTDLLNLDRFWKSILNNKSEKVTRVSQYLWNVLDPKKESLIPISKLKNRFFGKFHPDVQKMERKAREVENEFIKNLDMHNLLAITERSQISKHQFDDFISCWFLCTPTEEEFLTIFVECFRLSDFTNEAAWKNQTSNTQNFSKTHQLYHNKNSQSNKDARNHNKNFHASQDMLDRESKQNKHGGREVEETIITGKDQPHFNNQRPEVAVNAKRNNRSMGRNAQNFRSEPVEVKERNKSSSNFSNYHKR